MLVLTRMIGESIMIGDDIEVVLLASDRSKVRLGIKAPQSVPVHRQEIYQAIHSGEESEQAKERPELDLEAKRRARAS
jgi:carbon storage regulator